MWVGKTLTNDTHIVVQGNNVFVTRSIRRLPTPFVLEDLTACPWEFGYAALGHRLVYNKSVSPPLALGIGSGLPPRIDVEAIQVQNYAEDNPGDDDDADHNNEPQAGRSSVQLAAPSSGLSLPPLSDDVRVGGYKRDDSPTANADESNKRSKHGDQQPVTPEIDDEMADISERSPKLPRLSESPKQQTMNQVTSTDPSLYEHEDSDVQFQFDCNELDKLEQYDMEFYDDEYLQSSNDSDADIQAALKELTYPYGPHEPELDADELCRLDALADQVELRRLQKLSVLQDCSLVDANSKVLSTRFVRTWREKHDETGRAIWLRRSRFVAREFAWLEPERESLFSPASGSIISRVLPTLFLEGRAEKNTVMASIDVRDAFLTVKQRCPTLVHTTDANGVTRSFSLGRVLPGQRDGSLLWYQDVTDFLKQEFNMEECESYPCVLKTKDNSCILMIHVDDLLVVGDHEFVTEKFANKLRAKYDISMQVMRKPGDEVTFLKKTHTLCADGRLTIQAHHKHVHQMCSLLGLNPRTQNKKTPGHADMDLADTSAELKPEVCSTYRTCVGILMYLANDIPHCQRVIRHLSTYNSKPTEKSFIVMKHLVAYLACHGDICVSLHWSGRGNGVYHAYPDVNNNEQVLEVFTDSDWATDRATRRSVSCCAVFYGSCLLYSASRTQKLVSLSSAEAEVYACASGTSDSILLSRMLTWLTGKKTTINLYTDSSGAKGILQRHGVGRLRHLSCRILWLQDLIHKERRDWQLHAFAL